MGPLFLALAPSFARPAAANGFQENPLKRVRLVVLEAGNPGPAKVAFDVELEAGWHLYWVNPGDAGLAPDARWTLPPGFAASPLRHPVPKKFVQSGFISLGHESRVLLISEINPPPTGWPKGPWEAGAVLEWMACRESCLTGESPAKAAFPPSATALNEGRELAKAFSSRFPRPFSESGLTAGRGSAVRSGFGWRVEAAVTGSFAAEATEFFAYPVEGFVVQNAEVAVRGGKIVCPLVPSRGSGAPPPSAVRGVLVVAGQGYEIDVPVASPSLDRKLIELISRR